MIVRNRMNLGLAAVALSVCVGPGIRGGDVIVSRSPRDAEPVPVKRREIGAKVVTEPTKADLERQRLAAERRARKVAHQAKGFAQ